MNSYDLHVVIDRQKERDERLIGKLCIVCGTFDPKVPRSYPGELYSSAGTREVGTFRYGLDPMVLLSVEYGIILAHYKFLAPNGMIGTWTCDYRMMVSNREDKTGYELILAADNERRSESNE